MASVSAFTSSAKAKAEEAHRSLNNYITTQVQHVVGADK